MSFTNEAFSLMSLPSPSGSTLNFWHVGHLTTFGGQVFRFGGYNCWHIVAKGRGYVSVNGKVFQLNCGDMFSVMYDNEIEYGPVPGEDWAFYFIRIEGEGAGELSRQIGLRPEAPCLKHWHKEELLHLFASAWQAAKDNNRNPEFYASIVYRVCSLLCTENKPTARIPESLVEEALKIINDPLSQDFNVNELAAALHVSRVTLFNAFKLITGKSPHEHLIANQINLCKTLLRENPNLSIAELAKSTAYSSDKYLIRAFKRVTGMTPGQFRFSIKCL